MIFILNKRLEVLDTLNNFGDLSKITPFYDDLYVQDLASGAETFSFSTLANTTQSQHLVVANYIAFNYKGVTKLFHIIHIEESHDETFEKKVYCEMAGIELINEIVRPMKVTNSNLRKLLDSVLAETDWKLGKFDASFTEIFDFEINDYSSVYGVIQEYAIKKYGAEISFRVEMKNNTVVGQYIDVYKKRGKDDGFRFDYTANISEITRKVDTSDLCTALIGVGKNNITFKEIETGDKPLNQDFIASESAYKAYNNNGSHIMGVFKADTESPQELLKLTREELDKRSKPKTSYELKVELLGREVNIGDTVYIFDGEFNPPIMLEGRVSQLKESFTDEAKNECILANFKEIKSNITDELRGMLESRFPIGTNDILNEAVTGDKISTQYTTTVIADAVIATKIEVEDLIADKASIKDLEVINASIENLKATDVEVTGKLTASEAEIENLKATNVEITDKLTANKADIENLKATDVEVTGKLTAVEGEIGTLNAGIVDVSGKLTATEAEINLLKADVAEIDHVLAGNITAENIQAGTITAEELATGTITAGSGVIAEGAIGSAEISELDAVKISAGKIDTSKVEVGGEDGHLRIKGNRVQVFNGKGSQAVERVSMGDVNGDGSVYGLRVRGADGQTILLDENGVKNEGITDGAITNDKISSNAEIDGSKLNINSVIDKINEDGTEVIKGVKIEVEGTNLTAKLSTITEKQEEDSNKITKNTALIKANEDAIKLKVDEQTYSTDKEKMTKQLNKNTSSIDIIKDQIALKVEQTDIKKALDELEIGSGNFILNTSFVNKEKTYYSDGDIEVNEGVATITNATHFKMDLGTSFGALKRSDDIILSSIATLTSKESSVGLNKFIGGNIDVYSENHAYISESVKNLNLNMITIPVAVTIDGAESSNPYIEQWALNRIKTCLDNLKNTKAIDNSTKLIFEPHPIIQGGSISETLYNPLNKEEFFSKWKDLIVNTLTFLSDYKFYGIYIGTNFSQFDTGEDNLIHWGKLISELKSLYKNHKIIYRTNWWTTATWSDELTQAFEEKVSNPLWGKVDVISIASYFELNGNATPTADELYENLTLGTTHHNRGQKIFDEVKRFYDVWKKPVMFGELGCPSREYGAMEPWNNLTNNEESQVVQANLFEAYNRAFIYTNNDYPNDWFLGYSIFTLGTSSSEYDVVNKKAQDQIKKGIDFIQNNSNPYVQCEIKDKNNNTTLANMSLPLSSMMNKVEYVTEKIIFDGTDNSEIIFEIPANTTLTISKPMLACGTKAVSWNPSPQDSEGYINSKVAEIKVTTEGIKQSVSDLGISVSKKADGTTVTNLSNKVSSLESSVDNIKGEVNSLERTTTTLNKKVNDNEGNITNLKGEVTNVKNNVSTLSIDLGEITQRVDKTESTTITLTDKIDNIQVGGRNLLRNTDFKKLPPIKETMPGVSVAIKEGKLEIKTLDSYIEGNCIKFGLTKNIKPNSNITVSFIANTWSSLNTKVRFKMSYGAFTPWETVGDAGVDTIYTKTFNVGNITENDWLWIEFSYGVYILPNSLKIEEGTKPTDYTPAPEDVQANIDNIQVGGRNLLRNTNFYKHNNRDNIGWDNALNGTYGADHWSFYNGGVSNPNTGYHAHLFELDGELVVRYMEQANRWQSASYGETSFKDRLQKGVEYTYSFEIKGDTLDSKIFGGFYYYKIGESKPNFHMGQYSFDVKETGTWVKHKYTFTLPEDIDLTKSVTIYNYGERSKGVTYARKFKLEKGNKTTDWTPSDLDTQDQLDVNKTEITNTKNQVSQIKSDLSGISSKVSTLEQIEIKNRKVASFRYIRDWLNGSTANSGNHWCELEVWVGDVNIARGLVPTGNDTINNPLTNITDGNRHHTPYGEILRGGWKYVQIDLGQERNDVDMIKTWHYWGDNRAYNHKLEVSRDGQTWYELFNSDKSGKYRETIDGRTYVLNETYTENRLKTAESKITKDAITSTVKENFYSKSDIDGKGYQTQSQVQQTVNGLEIKISESGGYNILKNTGFRTGDIKYWSIQEHNYPTGSWSIKNSTHDWGFPDKNVNTFEMRLSDQSDKEYGLAQSFHTTIGKTYTVSFYYASHRCSRANIIIRKPDGGWLGSKSFNPSTTGGNSSIASWGYISYTFTATHIYHTLNIVLNDAQNDGYMWVAKPQIVEGSIALPYSHNLDEVYDGITSIDKDGITVKNSSSDTYTQIDTSSFSVNDNNGGTVAEFSRTSLIPNLNCPGTLTAGRIIANNIPTVSTSSDMSKWTHIYVQGDYGNDNNPGTGWGTNEALKTIDKALSLIPTIANQSYMINVGGSVSGTTLVGRSGSGVIEIHLEDDCVVNTAINLFGCTCRIRVFGNYSKKGTVKQGISINNCTSYDIGWVTFRGANWGTDYSCNILVNDHSRGIIRCNDFNGVSFAVILANNSEAWFYDNIGSSVTNYIGFKSYSRANLMLWGSDKCPDYTSHMYADAGHAGLYYIHDGASFNKTPSVGWNPSYTPTQRVSMWNFNNIWSDETLNGWNNVNELVQGYYSGWNTGRWTGYMQMSDGMAEIRNTISGGTNLSGRIYVQRRNSSGNSTGSKLHLYGSDGTLITNSTSINRGQGVWVPLNSSVVQKIQSGAITYFYLKADSNNASTYFKCESNAKIEITYTK